MTSALVKDESMLTTYFYGSHSIYTVWVDNQPLFNSQDVCRALGYENTENGKKAVQRHVANTYKKEWRDITARVGKDPYLLTCNQRVFFSLNLVFIALH